MTVPDSEGRSPAEADIAEAMAEFEYRKRAFHDTVGPLNNAMYGLLVARAKKAFPEASSIVLHGEMNETSNLTVHVTDVRFPGHTMDHDDLDAVVALEAFDEACWDVLSYCDLFGDDYYGETVIDLGNN